MPDATLHATCVVVGEAGVLIRGASGAGKSSLAHALLVGASQAGGFARLVCDDRVRLTNRGGRLVARPVPPLEGRLEVRGVGLLPVVHEPAAIVRLLVDCLGRDPARLPEPGERMDVLQGVAIPRLALRPEPALAQIVLWRLRDLCDTAMTE